MLRGQSQPADWLGVPGPMLLLGWHQTDGLQKRLQACRTPLHLTGGS